MAKVKKLLTLCGTQARGHGRAKVVARDGSRLTYRWPCGYEKTETLMVGPRGRQRQMSDEMVRFFARYWANGVTYECPKCRRVAARKAKKEEA